MLLTGTPTYKSTLFRTSKWDTMYSLSSRGCKTTRCQSLMSEKRQFFLQPLYKCYGIGASALSFSEQEFIFRSLGQEYSSTFKVCYILSKYIVWFIRGITFIKDNIIEEPKIFYHFRMSIWNTMMGTSLLAVPWAIEHSGLAMGFTIVFVMTIISFYTAFIIIDLYGKHNSKYIHMNFLVSGMSKSH